MMMMMMIDDDDDDDNDDNDNDNNDDDDWNKCPSAVLPIVLFEVWLLIGPYNAQFTITYTYMNATCTQAARDPHGQYLNSVSAEWNNKEYH